MGKVAKVSLLSAIGLLIVLFFVFRGYASLSQGYSWSEMDWNQDGSTSIGEFFEASDIGKRGEIQNGEKCIEYFAYKDGLAIKVVCPIKQLSKSPVALR